VITDRDLAAIESHLARQRRRRARHDFLAALSSPSGIIVTALIFALAILS
jgi:hypothetical protein